MPRVVAIAAAMAALLAGCGEEETDSGDAAGESADVAAIEAADLLEDTREVVRKLSERAEDPSDTEELEELRDEARGLARQAREGLPEDDPARQPLITANEQAAQASFALRQYASDGRENALERARTNLDEVRGTLARVVDGLRGRLPADVVQRLESALPDIPDVPSP
ncbi:MAG: hypothetical protein WD844_08925 [Thermoleophilaceae bacterium]